jgi:hypothetical protein
MRRIVLVLIAVLLLSSCKRGGLTIYAPAELAQGTIFIDGEAGGLLRKNTAPLSMGRLVEHEEGAQCTAAQ